jgi:hypothetical protein
MSLRSQAHCGRSLLHGFERILDLVETTLWREDGVIRVVCVECSETRKYVSNKIAESIDLARTMVGVDEAN